MKSPPPRGVVRTAGEPKPVRAKAPRVSPAAKRPAARKAPAKRAAPRKAPAAKARAAATAPVRKAPAAEVPKTVVARNVNHRDYELRLNGEKYEAVASAVLKVLPKRQGLTYTELVERVTKKVPEALFPGGRTVGWWTKAVQLDLEARNVIARDPEARPLRWRRLA